MPSLALASMFVALGYATSKPGLLAFLLALLESIVVLLPWLLACAALLVTLAILGFVRRYRWAASICVAAIAIGSTAVLVWVGGHATAMEHAGFHLLAVIAAAIGAWLAVIEWPGREARGVR